MGNDEVSFRGATNPLLVAEIIKDGQITSVFRAGPNDIVVIDQSLRPQRLHTLGSCQGVDEKEYLSCNGNGNSVATYTQKH